MSSGNQKVPLATQPVDIKNYKGSPVSADNPIQTTMPEPATAIVPRPLYNQGAGYGERGGCRREERV